jgi:hypothetical protein
MCVLAIALGLSLTVAKRTWLGRPIVRWVLVISVVMESVQLVNLYVRQPWAARLFWLVGPVILGMLAAEAIRTNRKRSNPPAARS